MKPSCPGTKSIRIAAAVIRDAGGNLLLVRKRGTSVFMQPGGKIEPGELPVDALARELHEEFGLAVDPAAARHLGRFTASAAHEPDCLVEAELFELAITATPRAAAEIEEMLWLPAASNVGVELAPLTREIVLPLCGRQR